MKRTTLSLIAVVAVLAAVVGIAALTAPSSPREAKAEGGDASGPVASAERKPVERTTLTCPRPWASDFGKTAYTAFTPEGEGGEEAAKGGKASLVPASEETGVGGQDDQDGKAGSGKGDASGESGKQDGKGDGKAKDTEVEPVAPLTAPGKPATATADDAKAPALVGTADGALAPGYTVQQTTQVSSGEGRGLLGMSCTPPAAEFWFAGASTSQDRQDYVHLTNPDATPAVVDVELFGKQGAIETPSGDGLTVPARSTVPVLLSTLTTSDETNLAVRVVARSGRVGAAVEAVDTKLGGDWLPASANPAGSVVLPGLPKDTAAVRLIVFAPGDDDADLKVRLATPTGSISPAGHETLHVKNGMTTAVDLGKITQGEPGALVLTPAEPGRETPVVAGLRIVRGKEGAQETAFISATSPVEDRASAAGSGPFGSTLYLTAPERVAKVRITSSAASGGGTAQTKTVEVKAGATLALEPPEPGGKGSYAISVQPVSGGPVYAARMLSKTSEDIPVFTVQPMPDDRATVPVPAAVQDLSVLN